MFFFCQADRQHGKNECPHFAEVTESYQKKLANRRNARYQEAVAALSPPAVIPTTSTHNSSLMDAAYYPIRSNYCNQLNTEVNIPDINSIIEPSTHSHRPKNPYAKGVLEAIGNNKSMGSPAPKRRRTAPMDFSNSTNVHAIPIVRPSTSVQRDASETPKNT